MPHARSHHSRHRPAVPWYEDAKRAPLASVAAHLGLTVRAATASPCPACASERRGSEDRRYPVSLGPRGWRCWRCGQYGSVLDLVALALTGEPSIRRPEVRAWFAAGGYCDPAGEPGAPPPVRRPPPPVEPAPAPKPRPEGLGEWWALLEPVDCDPEVAGYLRGRGIDPSVVADRSLARVVPPGARRPWWAFADPYRLVVPMYDATGELVSVKMRVPDRGSARKAMSPRGCSAGGAVFACGLGRQILTLGRLPEWWPPDRQLEIYIAEGEIDYLTLAATGGDADECAPAVLGVASGSWTSEVAARIPGGAVVLIATDNDDAGDQYAATIRQSLAARCRIRRMRGDR